MLALGSASSVGRRSDYNMIGQEVAVMDRIRKRTVTLERQAGEFFEKAEEMVKIALSQTDNAFEKAYRKFIASDEYSWTAKELFRYETEKAGGLRQIVEASIPRARAALSGARNQLEQVIQEINEGMRSGSESDSAVETRRDSISADSLFEGGIASVGIGVGIGAAVVFATAPISFPVLAGAAVASGLMIGFGAGSIAAAANLF